MAFSLTSRVKTSIATGFSVFVVLILIVYMVPKPVLLAQRFFEPLRLVEVFLLANIWLSSFLSSRGSCEGKVYDAFDNDGAENDIIKQGFAGSRATAGKKRGLRFSVLPIYFSL
jgi:hypothetical protein